MGQPLETTWTTSMSPGAMKNWSYPTLDAGPGELAPSITAGSTWESGPSPHLGSTVELALIAVVWVSGP